jgi:hypothetical protein
VFDEWTLGQLTSKCITICRCPTQYTSFVNNFDIIKKNYYRRLILFIIIKWKNKKYHAVGTVPNSNRKMVERGKIATTNTQIHDRSLSWLDAGFSIKRSAVKLVYVPILPHTLLLVKLCCYVSVFHMWA